MIRYIIPSVTSELKLERHCPNCGRFGGNIHSNIYYRPISDIKVNYMHGRTGHLWQNRFYSCPLDRNNYYKALRYIEQNPVRTRMVRYPWRYRWSSAGFHIGRDDEFGLLNSKRWRIETLFREVKINLSADVLRSMCPQAIRKEVAAKLIAVNIVRMIMLKAAIEKAVDPIRISFVHAVRAILMFAPALACEPMWKLPQIYRKMLAEIGTNLVPERPGRNEPRAVTRERKHYPKLRSTREQWRKAYAA